jgi:hypothetical protein
MNQETYVCLKIFSEKMTSDEITAAVGVHCDRSWKIGDIRGKTIIKEKNHGWVVESGLSKEATLEEHIEALMRRLEPFINKIQQLSGQNDVCFSCVIYSEYNPPLFFEKAVIKWISALGACMDLDTYVLGEASDLPTMPFGSVNKS